METSNNKLVAESRVVTLIRPAGLIKKKSFSVVEAPPLGLAYLAGTLTSNSIITTVIDAVGEKPDQFIPLDFMDGFTVGLSNEEIVERIHPNADIIGVSCMFSNSWPQADRLTKLVRKHFPDSVIVLGGEHVTACANFIIESCPEIDICVMGEGEEILLNLVNCLRSNSDITQVKGILTRVNGEVYKCPSHGRIKDLDSIPLPNWDLVPIKNYMDKKLGLGVCTGRSMPLLASRGCPFQCTFCSSPNMWTTFWSARNPHHLIDEMESYIEKYQVDNFDLYDLTAIVRKDWIVEFTNELIRRGLNTKYQLPSGTRTEIIDAEVVDLLYRSGCTNLTYAPESGSPETLKRIKKKVKLGRLQRSLRTASKRGLKVSANIILFPDDNFKDVLKTFSFILKCSWLGLRDATFASFLPYPGTELYEQLREEGKIPPMSEEYFISLTTYSDLGTIRSYNNRFSDTQVQFFRIMFYVLFYGTSYLFRPYRIYTNIRNIKRNLPTTRGEQAIRLLIKHYVGTR